MNNQEISTIKRVKILEDWVVQSPAPPIIQYVRDAEKEAAWKFLKNKLRILDIASEVNVTKGINARHITRLDFSSKSSEVSQKSLTGFVNEFYTVNPGKIKLPFPDNYFDGIVCIGPYDWKFLEIYDLTKEVYRVCAQDGNFVFSVPTKKSPYYAGGKDKFRYFSLSQLDRLKDSFAWHGEDYSLIYQYPRCFHSLINRLPEKLQNPFVSMARRNSIRYTQENKWKNASYIVVSLKKINYQKYLNTGVGSVFRTLEENGFWDKQENMIIRALHYNLKTNGEINWIPNKTVKWRYAPFCLMGVMYWRASYCNYDRYDLKIRAELDYFVKNITDNAKIFEMPSYCIGPLIASFSLAYRIFNEQSYRDIALYLYDHSSKRFNFENSEDSLLLYGWSVLYDIHKKSNLPDDINKVLKVIIKKQNKNGLFVFNNPTTKRHQNQMYALWGISRAIKITDNKKYLKNVEKCIEYTINNRMLENGAFIWEDRSYFYNKCSELKHYNNKNKCHWKLLFECHQTFFVNAVFAYYEAGGNKKYNIEINQALNWITGNNILNKDLVELSGLGFPMRMMTVNGNIHVNDQMFKGTYEIGSYIMALTDYIKMWGG